MFPKTHFSFDYLQLLDFYGSYEIDTTVWHTASRTFYRVKVRVFTPDLQ